MRTVFRPVVSLLAAIVFSLILIGPIAFSVGMAQRQSQGTSETSFVFYRAVLGISR